MMKLKVTAENQVISDSDTVSGKARRQVQGCQLLALGLLLSAFYYGGFSMHLGDKFCEVNTNVMFGHRFPPY
jgi:arginine utilization protein RocB